MLHYQLPGFKLHVFLDYIIQRFLSTRYTWIHSSLKGIGANWNANIPVQVLNSVTDFIKYDKKGYAKCVFEQCTPSWGEKRYIQQNFL